LSSEFVVVVLQVVSRGAASFDGSRRIAPVDMFSQPLNTVGVSASTFTTMPTPPTIAVVSSAAVNATTVDRGVRPFNVRVLIVNLPCPCVHGRSRVSSHTVWVSRTVVIR
jgi:hypothetical protein